MEAQYGEALDRWLARYEAHGGPPPPSEFLVEETAEAEARAAAHEAAHRRGQERGISPGRIDRARYRQGGNHAHG